MHNVLERINEPAEDREAFMQPLADYLDAQIEDHRANPRDDLTNYLLNVEIAGNKLSDEHVRGSILLLLVAGIDTTWSSIGSALLHLATNPEDRQRLVDEPDLIPTAIEEFSARILR